MCPIGFLMLGSTLQDLPSDSPAACRSACRRRRASLRTGSHQRTILACTRPILAGHAVELATAQPPPTTTARSKPTPRLAQQRLRQLRAPGADSGRRRAGRSWTQRATTPTPAIQAYGCLPTPRSRTSLRPDTADAATHRHRTPTPDAGQRTPGRSDARTGHRTPDAGRGRGQVTTARPASGPPEPPRRATVRWDAQPCSCGRAPAALGSPCRLGGEAAFQREIASRRQLLGRSARVERRLGALLSSDDYGLSVERRAKLHPVMTSEHAVV
jgi:hypothetical protein